MSIASSHYPAKANSPTFSLRGHHDSNRARESKAARPGSLRNWILPLFTSGTSKTDNLRISLAERQLSPRRRLSSVLIFKVLALTMFLLIWHKEGLSWAVVIEEDGKCTADAGYQQLQTRQEEAYRKNPRNKHWTGSEEDWAILKDVFTRLGGQFGEDDKQRSLFWESMKRDLSVSLPTCYEDPRIHWVLRGLNASVLDAARTLGLELVDPPRFGTLPIRQVNAAAMLAENDEGYIVILNGDLFTMTHEMTKLGLDALDLMDPSGISLESAVIERRLKAKPDLMARLAILALEFMGNNRGEHVYPQAHYATFLPTIVEAIETFAVAHEYGHVLLKHRPSIVGQKENKHEDVVKQIERAWRQEIEADLVAFELLKAVIHKKVGGNAKNYLELYLRMAPILFFDYVSVIEEADYIDEEGRLPPEPDIRQVNRAVDLLQSAFSTNGPGKVNQDKVWGKMGELNLWNGGSSTHPPTWLRQAFMQLLIAKEPSASISDETRQRGMLGVALHEYYQALWGLTKPGFLQATRASRDKRIGPSR